MIPTSLDDIFTVLAISRVVLPSYRLITIFSFLFLILPCDLLLKKYIKEESQRTKKILFDTPDSLDTNGFFYK
jgi:hypothetical protein